MNKGTRASKIRRIPIKDIQIINPRVRNKKAFEDMTENIAKVGLKRPITVTRNTWSDDKPYALVCGQGRLEAYLACGQTKVPAMVIDVEEEEALTMSLVENLARRFHTSLDLLKGVEVLLERKYTPNQIAEKTGLSPEYVKPIVRLIKQGEERLLAAVETGQMALDIAVKIVAAPGEEQKALQDAYENNELRGKKFLVAKRLIETRRNRGKNLSIDKRSKRSSNSKPLSGRDVLKLYNKEVDRKKSLIKKAEFVNSQLQFIIEALRSIYQDELFSELLTAERLNTLPKPISEIMDKREMIHAGEH